MLEIPNLKARGSKNLPAGSVLRGRGADPPLSLRTTDGSWCREERRQGGRRGDDLKRRTVSSVVTPGAYLEGHQGL